MFIQKDWAAIERAPQAPEIGRIDGKWANFDE